MSFTPNPDGIRKIFEEIAAKMKAVDQELRAKYTGKPWKDIEEPAAQAFAAAGVHFTGDISDYAKSIENNEDFTFKIG